MNPENRGEHIQLRHSHLWRKPLSYEKPVPNAASCHRQLNERTSFTIQSVPADKAGEPETTPFSPTPMDSETDLVSPTETLPINSRNSWPKKTNSLIYREVW